jgi:O-antigen ligase
MFLAILGALMVLGLVRKRRILPFIWSVTKTTAVVAVLLTGIYSMLNALAPAYTEAFELRILGSLETSVMDSDEPFVLGSRIYETQMAIEHIVENPFFGLGTGAAYREILPFEFSQVEVAENPEDGRHFMHNIYLFVWMKYGLWGALALGWIAWHFVRQTWVLARQPGDETILPQGILVAFSGIAIANLAAPSFVVSPATPTLVAIMAGFIEVCNLSRQRGLKRSEGRAVDSMSSPSLADPVG